MRITPASTFKIPHALAALDSGILAGPNVTFVYDEATDGPQTWKRAHTLATAMRYSVVWYFQRVATMLGPDRERRYLAKFDYGNRDASSGLTTFWLDESLRISPDEQERFLVRLYEDALPVNKDAMQTVRQILVQPRNVVVNAFGEHSFAVPWPAGSVVSAKTGSGDNVRWLIGHVERKPRAWVFVSCVIGTDLDPVAAIDLAANRFEQNTFSERAAGRAVACVPSAQLRSLMDPIPPAMLDYNAVAAEYAKYREVHPGVLAALLNTGAWSDTSRILEVGCGTANYLDRIQRALGCRCTGVDPSEQMLARARNRGVKADLFTGRAEQLEFYEGSFDLVFSVDVIHHVSDRRAHYREAARVLATGGHVCTATDSEEAIRRREPLSVYFPETVEVDLTRYPRIADLRGMMSEAGFGAIHEVTEEAASETTDIDVFRSKAFSCLHLISSEAFERGIRRMEEDLRKGPIPCVSRYVLLWGTK